MSESGVGVSVKAGVDNGVKADMGGDGVGINVKAGVDGSVKAGTGVGINAPR